ncbi:pre-RNA processing PIH1/Nop17-domain-containing protein [Lanmaoa asiatica]|nr:pre-RNA processing PIH1/Nop17-domain-containing protein [Lanmaoa asiatica]
METATSSKVAVALNPVPGFCVKSRATNDALVHLTASDQYPDVPVKKGLKIFVNIAWDPNVPPPPPGSDDAIHRAMHAGLDIDDYNPEAWFVPIVLSDARQDSDKAGQSAIVFDCVLNSSIKSRSLKDPDFKSFIIELAFQRIEAQTTLILSRQIGIPNIASKGKPESRRVFVPVALYPPGHPNRQALQTLVQEIPDRSTSAFEKAPPPKSILGIGSENRIPVWSWTQQGSSIRVVFDVPGVTHAVIPESTLDVEPKRILLHIPALYDLDINLDAPDSELLSVFGNNETTNEALKLKRVRSLDVGNALAEWHVADSVIILLA